MEVFSLPNYKVSKENKICKLNDCQKRNFENENEVIYMCESTVLFICNKSDWNDTDGSEMEFFLIIFLNTVSKWDEKTFQTTTDEICSYIHLSKTNVSFNWLGKFCVHFLWIH